MYLHLTGSRHAVDTLAQGLPPTESANLQFSAIRAVEVVHIHLAVAALIIDT
jgi:hypothetical protein